VYGADGGYGSDDDGSVNSFGMPRNPAQLRAALGLAGGGGIAGLSAAAAAVLASPAGTRGNYATKMGRPPPVLL